MNGERDVWIGNKDRIMYQTLMYNLVVVFEYHEVNDLLKVRDELLDFLISETIGVGLPLSIYASTIAGDNTEKIGKIDYLFMLQVNLEKEEESGREEKLRDLTLTILHNVIKSNMLKFIEQQNYKFTCGVNVVVNHGPLIRTLSDLKKNSSLIIVDQLGCIVDESKKE